MTITTGFPHRFKPDSTVFSEAHLGGHNGEHFAAGGGAIHSTVLYVDAPHAITYGGPGAMLDGCNVFSAYRLDPDGTGTTVRRSMRFWGVITDEFEAMFREGTRRLFESSFREYVERGVRYTGTRRDGPVVWGGGAPARARTSGSDLSRAQPARGRRVGRQSRRANRSSQPLHFAVDGKMIRGEGYVLSQGKTIMRTQPNLGWDPVAKHVSYVDFHNHDTVYVGHVSLEDGWLVYDFSELARPRNHFEAKSRITDDEHYEFLVGMRPSG